MENLNKVNNIIEHFYKLFYATEELALKRGMKSLTHTELHLIEAVGKDSLTMNELSDRLGITMGTATVAIAKLTEKGFIYRVRSDSDRRKVYVSLSKKGADALSYHNAYHKNILGIITKNVPEKDLAQFTKTFEIILNNLQDNVEFFKPQPITEFEVGTLVSIDEVKGTPIIQDYFSSYDIEHYSVVKIMKSKEKDKVVLKKVDGSTLIVNIIDAKNLIATKVDN